MKFVKSVTVIVFNKDKVLFVKSGKSSGHAKGIYSLPAGRLEDGESYEGAAVREFHEESGLQTDVNYLVKLPTFYKAKLERKDNLKNFCAWSFYCTKYWGKLRNGDEGVPLWVKTEDVGNLHLQVNVDRMITEALEYLKNKS